MSMKITIEFDVKEVGKARLMINRMAEIGAIPVAIETPREPTQLEAKVDTLMTPKQAREQGLI